MHKGEMDTVLVGCFDGIVCEEADRNEERHSGSVRPLPHPSPMRVIGCEGRGSGMSNLKTCLILPTFKNLNVFENSHPNMETHRFLDVSYFKTLGKCETYHFLCVRRS